MSHIRFQQEHNGMLNCNQSVIVSCDAWLTENTHKHCIPSSIRALSAGLEHLCVLNSPFIVLAMTASNRGAWSHLMHQQLIDVLSCALKPALRQSSFSTPGLTHAHQDMCSGSFGSSVVPHFTMSLPVLFSALHLPENTSHSHCCSFDT